jgi:non-heme chloroperoxidase
MTLPHQVTSRRNLLVKAAVGAAGAGLAAVQATAHAAGAATIAASAGNGALVDNGDGYLVVADGTRVHYKDIGAGQPVVFSHGWPLQADAWEDQMFSWRRTATA